MNFQVLSDLHLELRQDNLSDIGVPTVVAPNLFLAGDIGNPFLDGYSIFIRWCSQNYDLVIVISGNHEYYNRYKYANTMNQVEDKIRDVVGEFNNVHFLQKQTLQIENTLIIGSTLWSNIPTSKAEFIKNSVNDYSRILMGGRIVTPEDTTRLHKEHKRWIFGELSRAEANSCVKQVIVMTHHTPSYLMIADAYVGDPINYAYATNLEPLLRNHKKLKVWISGHTHGCKCIPLKLGTTNIRLISNCRGHQHEDTGYDSSRIYTL